MIEVLGLKIYGTPQQPIFLDWAFNKTDDRLRVYYENIPEGLDILVSHAPAYGTHDMVTYRGETSNIGSKELMARVNAVRPRYVVSGHAHSNYGVETKDGITYVGCSVVDERYRLVRTPIYLEVEVNE